MDNEKSTLRKTPGKGDELIIEWDPNNPSQPSYTKLITRTLT